jgi:arylformamidase
MKIHDISLTVTNEMVVWPSDPKVKLERVNKIEEGKNANVSHLDMGVHTGTHVDAPFHFLPGEKTVETLQLDILIGQALVVEIPDSAAAITAVEVEQAAIPAGTVRVLFKTRNSTFWRETEPVFHTDFVGVSADGAEALVARGIRLVGLDYLSIAPYKKSRPTHEVLLKAAMVVVEGLDLGGIAPGTYTLVCLPVKLGGSDGAPARAVLME